MSVVAAIRKMLEGGLSIEQALIAAEAFEGARPIDAAAERRRAYDRERKAKAKFHRNSTGTDGNSATSTGIPQPPSPSPAPSPDKEKSPLHPSKENNLFPLPPSTPRVSGGREQALFDRFWEAYPHKVGKADARKAFSKALSRVDVDTMAAGLHRYAAKADDRPWCNPATWLNQDRWSDAPAAQPRASPATRPTKMEVLKDRLRQRIENEQRTDGQGSDDLLDAGRLPLLAGPNQRGND